MDAQTQGFDVVYQIDQASLLNSLERLVMDQVALRLASLDLFVLLPSPAPANPVQHGTLKILSMPTATLDLPAVNPSDPTLAGLTITFPQTLLQLDAVAAVLGFPGVGALPPTAAGQLTIGLRLSFSAQPFGGGSTVVISPAATPAVSQLDSLPDLSSLSALIKLAPLVQAAAATAVQNAIAPLFPLPISVPFEAPNVCGIGVRTLDVKLLGAGSGTKPAIGFFLTLLDTSQGNIGNATQSSLTPDVSGAIVLSNAFLKTLVCCLLRTNSQVAGLSDPTSDDTSGCNLPDSATAACCHWKGIDNVQLGPQRVRIEDLCVCVVSHAGAQSTIHLWAHATQSGTGWTAHATLDVDLQLVRDGNALGVLQLTPTANTWSDVSPWVWIIVGLAAALGALAGLIVGGPAGAWQGGVIGAAIGFALVGVVYFVLDGIGSLAAQAVSGVLGQLGAGNINILPKAVTENFGSIIDIQKVDFDDLFVGGSVLAPSRNNILHEGADVILGLGDEIDLDRGVIQRAGQTAAGFALEGDLLWRPDPPVAVLARVASTPPPATATGTQSASTAIARTGLGSAVGGVAWFTGTLVPLASARLLPVGASFWSLTESALSTVAFPQTGLEIGSTAIAVSDSPYPSGAVVFAVRTSEGHLAKCLAWRDRWEQLHLSYVTYDTTVPLRIASQWTTTRGPVVNTTPVSQVYQVSRVGSFRAVTHGLNWPPFFPPPPEFYVWFWNGQSLGSSGMLTDGTTTYNADGPTLKVQTAMGTTLQGVLQVELFAFGQKFATTLDINEPGTERDTPINQLFAAAPAAPAPVRPAPPPAIADQLPAAFARGMGIRSEQVRFR